MKKARLACPSLYDAVCVRVFNPSQSELVTLQVPTYTTLQALNVARLGNSTINKLPHVWWLFRLSREKSLHAIAGWLEVNCEGLFVDYCYHVCLSGEIEVFIQDRLKAIKFAAAFNPEDPQLSA